MTYPADARRRAINRSAHEDDARKAARVLVLRRALREIRARIAGRVQHFEHESVSGGVLADIDRLAEAALKGGANYPEIPFPWETLDDARR